MCDRLDFWRYSSMLAEGEIVKAKIVCHTFLYRIFRLYIYKKKDGLKKTLQTGNMVFHIYFVIYLTTNTFN